jgi:hypothetical protein
VSESIPAKVNEVLNALNQHAVDDTEHQNRGHTPLTFAALQTMMEERTATFCERMQSELRTTLQARDAALSTARNESV